MTVDKLFFQGLGTMMTLQVHFNLIIDPSLCVIVSQYIQYLQWTLIFNALWGVSSLKKKCNLHFLILLVSFCCQCAIPSLLCQSSPESHTPVHLFQSTSHFSNIITAHFSTLPANLFIVHPASLCSLFVTCFCLPDMTSEAFLASFRSIQKQVDIGRFFSV